MPLTGEKNVVSLPQAEWITAPGPFLLYIEAQTFMVDWMFDGLDDEGDQ